MLIRVDCHSTMITLKPIETIVAGLTVKFTIVVDVFAEINPVVALDTLETLAMPVPVERPDLLGVVNPLTTTCANGGHVQ